MGTITRIQKHTDRMCFGKLSHEMDQTIATPGCRGFPVALK